MSRPLAGSGHTSRARVSRTGGALAIVLHTHMPYVEGFGTWPFGEEWLWEAIAGCYLPLLEVLDAGAPLTLSLTPVLCDQLEAPGVGARFVEFVERVRRQTHAEDAAGLRAAGHERLAAELDRSWGEYEQAAARMRELGGDLLAALAPHARWTSSATHAVLPLLASDAGVREQLRCGIASHARRFGERWGGGLWLPECAHAPWLEPLLLEAGVTACCVETTRRYGVGAPEHLRPLMTTGGLLLAPVDRATMALVWSEQGYPAAGAYRDYHHHTIHHHNPWRIDGEPYDSVAALALAREHAADFVTRTRERLAEHGAGAPGGGLVVCALDTELLGHWWYEGVAWLRAVVAECERQGLELLALDDALERCEPEPVDTSGWLPSSWGSGGDLSTWSGPAVAELAFGVRAAELRVLAAGRGVSPAAVRELLALQASDWPFLVSRELAADYARERIRAHGEGLERALAEGAGARPDGLRGIAPGADTGAFLAPL